MLGGITLPAGFDEDVTAAVPDGVEVEIDRQAATLTVMLKAPRSRSPSR